MKIEILELTEDNFLEFEGLFEALNNLSPTPEMDNAQALQILHTLQEANTHLYVLVGDRKIISSTTLLLEKKFLRNGALCGHIEDVVTHKDFMRQGYGKQLISFVVEQAKLKGCYKVVLYCAEAVVPFYEKNDFVIKGVFMEKRF